MLHLFLCRLQEELVESRKVDVVTVKVHGLNKKQRIYSRTSAKKHRDLYNQQTPELNVIGSNRHEQTPLYNGQTYLYYGQTPLYEGQASVHNGQKTVHNEQTHIHSGRHHYITNRHFYKTDRHLYIRDRHLFGELFASKNSALQQKSR